MHHHNQGILRLLAFCLLLQGVWLLGDAGADPRPTASPPDTGARISLDLQRADLVDVLRLIAAVSRLNILTSPEVSGTVTTRLLDVPWEQALDVILKLHRLAMERHGNVLLIAPLEHFQTQRQDRLRHQQVNRHTESVITRLIPVTYADAEALQVTLQRFLGACANIAVDKRTNTLILRGTPSCLRLGQGVTP